MAGGGGMSSEVSGMDRLRENFKSGGVRNPSFSSSMDFCFFMVLFSGSPRKAPGTVGGTTATPCRSWYKEFISVGVTRQRLVGRGLMVAIFVSSGDVF